MGNYEKEQERLLRLLEEVDTEAEEVEPFDDETDEEQVDQETFSNHESGSEQSISDIGESDESVSMHLSYIGNDFK